MDINSWLILEKELIKRKKNLEKELNIIQKASTNLLATNNGKEGNDERINFIMHANRKRKRIKDIITELNEINEQLINEGMGSLRTTHFNDTYDSIGTEYTDDSMEHTDDSQERNRMDECIEKCMNESLNSEEMDHSYESRKTIIPNELPHVPGSPPWCGCKKCKSSRGVKGRKRRQKTPKRKKGKNKNTNKKRVNKKRINKKRINKKRVNKKKSNKKKSNKKKSNNKSKRRRK